MKNKFREVCEATASGQTGRIQFNIDGEIYTRLFRPKERLILLGGGHIAKCLCTMASMVEFDIVVVDDREEYANRDRFPEASEVICDDFANAIRQLQISNSDYVVVVTRAHQYDAQCLHAVLDSVKPYYIGLLGSKRRTTNLLSTLESEGIPSDRLSDIKTPIGLNINALTVEEITVSIVAELIKYRRKDLRKKSGSHTLVEETFHTDVVNRLVNEDKPQALLLVYDTIGSSPVKSGSFMTVNGDGICNGTIGGGLVENLALQDALSIIGTGEQIIRSYKLNEDEATLEGMVCGGTMKLLIMDI